MTDTATLQSNPCAYCEEPTDQEPQEYGGIEQIICDRCSDEFEYCQICKIHHDNESTCRHLFWSNQGGDWLGCGSDRGEWDFHKKSFHAVLDKIGVDAAKVLLNSLKTHRYWHQFSGTIFGYERLTADWVKEGDSHSEDFGHLFTQELTDEQEAAMAIGVGWLVSLWSGTSPESAQFKLPQTPEADDVTAVWVQEWLLSQPITLEGGENVRSGK